MAETKRTNTQYVFPVNARFAQGFAWVARGPTLAPEKVGPQSHSLRHNLGLFSEFYKILSMT